MNPCVLRDGGMSGWKFGLSDLIHCATNSETKLKETSSVFGTDKPTVTSCGRITFNSCFSKTDDTSEVVTIWSINRRVVKCKINRHNLSFNSNGSCWHTNRSSRNCCTSCTAIQHDFNVISRCCPTTGIIHGTKNFAFRW